MACRPTTTLIQSAMLSHALTIVANELNKHLADTYGTGAVAAQVGLGNMAEGVVNATGGGGVPRDILVFSLVNIREEKTLKNLPNSVKDEATLKLVYQNPPVFVNCQILVAASHVNYTNALLMLSRAMRFFQFKNVFTQDTVDPGSITTNAPANPLDQLESFKLIFDLCSPTLEEINHLWGTLGGKQYPFALYMLRLLELRFKAAPGEEGALVSDVVRNIHVKN